MVRTHPPQQKNICKNIRNNEKSFVSLQKLLGLKPTTNKTDCVTYPVGKKAGHLNTFLKNICKDIRNNEKSFVSLQSCSEVGSI